jgi:hypothetical protein
MQGNPWGVGVAVVVVVAEGDEICYIAKKE